MYLFMYKIAFCFLLQIYLKQYDSVSLWSACCLLSLNSFVISTCNCQFFNLYVNKNDMFYGCCLFVSKHDRISYSQKNVVYFVFFFFCYAFSMNAIVTL